ncbi:MAG: glycosyltransferase family 4 protein [Candidatus Omnitrophota bacterium]
MKILYIHRTQGKGVEGIHIRGIVEALRRMGHTVDMDCPVMTEGKGALRKRFDWLSKNLPEYVFELMEIFYNFLAFRKIRQKFSLNKYDFVYERFAFFSWAGTYLAKRFNIPYMLEVNYTSYTPLVRRRTKVLLPFVRYIERKSFENADAIFVVSSFLKKQLIALGISDGKIYLTPNAVDEKIFSFNFSANEIKDKCGLSGRNIIGFVGGFYPWHGLELLLEAVKNIEKKRNNLCLFLVGDGPMKVRLEEIKTDLKIMSKLIFAGKVEYEELPKYIASMDVCVMPNSNNYGSPMKIFEYMAMGKPVVAPRLGPLEDVIDDDKNGLLFEPQNVFALAACIERILDDDELNKRIRENARNNVFKNHLWKNNAAKIIDVCYKLKHDEKEDN